MIIIADTREKEKNSVLEFEPEYTHYTRDKYYNIVSEEVEKIEVVRAKLDVGDYQGEYANGKKSKFIIERKALPDLWGTLTNDYKRFREEIERAREAGIHLIICIEGSYSKIRGGFKYHRRPSKEIQEQLRTIWIKYGVTHTYCVSRTEMANYIVDTFVWCGKKELWV